MSESNPTEDETEDTEGGWVQEWWPKICHHKHGAYWVFEVSISTLEPRNEWYDTCRRFEANLNSRQRYPEQWVLRALEDEQRVAEKENFEPGPIRLDW